MKKHVPNILSSSRIVLSGTLLFLAQRPAAFTVMYCMIAVTDFFDGKLARKFNAQSRIGAKLDGLGDLSTFVVGFICIMFLIELEIQLFKTVFTLSFPMAGKLFNFIHTRVRFKEWNLLHTYTNKLLGAVLYLAVPIFVLLGAIHYYFVLGVTTLGLFSVVEDTIILSRSDTYNVNYKGLLFEPVKKMTAVSEEGAG